MPSAAVTFSGKINHSFQLSQSVEIDNLIQYLYILGFILLSHVMSQQLFDLDQALDEFEHEELGKLASVSTQPFFEAKPFLSEDITETGSCGASCQNSTGTQREEIISLLNSTSIIQSAKTVSTVNLGKSSCGHLINPTILDEDAKDSCGDGSGTNICHPSRNRNTHLIIEDHSSSNMDSGLCSSSEFIPFESDVQAASGGSGELSSSFSNNMLTNASKNPVFNANMNTNSNYKEDVALLFCAPQESNSAADKDSTAITPTMTQAEKMAVLTPVVARSFASEKDTDDNNSDNKNQASSSESQESFFHPNVEDKTDDEHKPVAVSEIKLSEDVFPKKGGGRRPCSLLLSDSSQLSCQPNRPISLQPTSVATKRPSSLFGLPCVSSEIYSAVTSSNDSPKLDKKPMLHVSENFSSVTDSDSRVNDVPAVAFERRSPSNLSANSEILQLPVPVIPSSSSSYSPDSGSLSRSSLCEGLPSPMEVMGASVSAVETGLDTDMSEIDVGDTSIPPINNRMLPCGDTLGRQAPPWVPDCDAPNCTGCNMKFTFTKRRHHCRACGKVYCNSCCSLRYSLEYLNAVARVCIACYPELVRLEARKNNADVGPPVAAPSALKILKSETTQNDAMSQKSFGESRRNKKKVVFSDGVRPGEQPNSVAVASSSDPSPSVEASCAIPETPTGEEITEKLVPADPLRIEASFYWSDIKEIARLETVLKNDEPVVVVLNPALAIKVQQIDLSCCCPAKGTDNSTSHYYCIVSVGLCTSTESEFVVVLKTENLVSHMDYVVKLYERIWTDADQGRFYEEFSCISLNNAAFIIFKPSFQCSQNLLLPSYSRWMAAVLITDPNEVAWARLFPLRLLLRLGHECSHYPTTIISDLTRQPLFHQQGHTVLTLFSDFRSFRYRLECVEGAVLHLDRACSSFETSEVSFDSESNPPKSKKHILLLPITSSNFIRQMVCAGNERVLAIGTSFSPSADGHLVAVQAGQPDTSYRTEAITMLGVSHATDQIKVLAGSFIIFNGSLRLEPNGNTRARMTVLEDGAMLQLTVEQMTELRSALTSTTNLTINCSTANAGDGESTGNDSLEIQWVQSSLELPSQWTRPQIALRCRLPIGFHVTMAASLAQSVKTNAFLRVASVYSWPFDPNAQALWCSSSVFAIAASVEQSSNPSQANPDPLTNKSVSTAFVLDRASLALASSTQLALAPFADSIIRSAFAANGDVVLEMPVQVIVRVRLDPESLGFEATVLSPTKSGSDVIPLPQLTVHSLDSELVPTLFNLAQSLGSKLPPGGLCFEIVLFSMPPIVMPNLIQNTVVEPTEIVEVTPADMLIEDS